MDIGSMFLNVNCKGNEINKSESFDKNQKLKLLFGKIIQEQYSFFQTKKQRTSPVDNAQYIER